jgi:hypothetical protein
MFNPSQNNNHSAVEQTLNNGTQAPGTLRAFGRSGVSLVKFTESGEAVFIYEDGHPLLELGRPEITRASHVKPNEEGLWVADMGPVGGPRLEGRRNRREALELEREWLGERLNKFEHPQTPN